MGDLLAFGDLVPNGGDFGRVMETNGELVPMNDSKPDSLRVDSDTNGGDLMGLAEEKGDVEPMYDSNPESFGGDSDVVDSLVSDEDSFTSPESNPAKGEVLDESKGAAGEVLLVAENIC